MTADRCVSVSAIFDGVLVTLSDGGVDTSPILSGRGPSNGQALFLPRAFVGLALPVVARQNG